MAAKSKKRKLPADLHEAEINIEALLQTTSSARRAARNFGLSQVCQRSRIMIHCSWLWLPKVRRESCQLICTKLKLISKHCCKQRVLLGRAVLEAYNSLQVVELNEVEGVSQAQALSPDALTTWLVAKYDFLEVQKMAKILVNLPETLTPS